MGFCSLTCTKNRIRVPGCPSTPATLTPKRALLFQCGRPVVLKIPERWLKMKNLKPHQTDWVRICILTRDSNHSCVHYSLRSSGLEYSDSLMILNIETDGWTKEDHRKKCVVPRQQVSRKLVNQWVMGWRRRWIRTTKWGPSPGSNVASATSPSVKTDFKFARWR